MIFNVYNRDLCVHDLQIEGVSASSVVLIGDTEQICLSSIFDTPPESLIIGPFVPLTSQ